MYFLSTTTQPDAVLTIPCNQYANKYNNVNTVFFVLSIYLTFITSALKCSMELQVEYFLIDVHLNLDVLRNLQFQNLLSKS